MENQARTQLHATHRGHGAEALAEDQSRRSGGTSEDWGWRSGSCGGQGPMDIEVACRLCMRCGRSSDSDGRDLLYAGPVQHAGPHHSTALMEQGERCRPGRGWIG